MAFVTVGRSPGQSKLGSKSSEVGNGIAGPDKLTAALASAALTTNARTSYTATASDGFNSSRYAPNSETLDKIGLVDDITPKTDQALMQLCKMMYDRDAVAGPATDLISTLPWSDWSLYGIKDPEIMRIYETAMEEFDPEINMPLITREYLMYGRFSASMVYNSNEGSWGKIIPHDQMFVDITPVPIHGLDPLLDLRATPEMKACLESRDPRMKAMHGFLPEKMRKELAKGAAKLDPITTLFVPRRVTTTDWKGTSMFMRILPYFAIEKALVTSTISAARRRTRSILHLTVGVEGQWEPQPEDLDAVTSLFQATEDDPVGAIIATRNGINANEVRSGADFWKISEEADYLRTSKLNAFGLSDAFLSGEASYSTMEAALSVFIENIKVLRATIQKRVFEDKIFDVLARHHGFVRRKEADRAHGVRTSLASKSLEEGLRIPKRDLMLPSIHWTKSLSPESDANYIEILKSIQEQGIPVTAKKWASAGGIDINDLENELPEDKLIKERLKKYKPAPAPEEGGDGGFGAFSSFLDKDAVRVLGSFANHGDHANNKFFDVPYSTIQAIALELTSTNRTMRTLRDNEALGSWLNSRLDGDTMKVDATKYMLTRMGLTRARVSDEFVSCLANKLSIAASVLDKKRDKATAKSLATEVEILIAVASTGKKHRGIIKKADRNEILAALKAGASYSNTSSYSGA